MLIWICDMQQNLNNFTPTKKNRFNEHIVRVNQGQVNHYKKFLSVLSRVLTQDTRNGMMDYKVLALSLLEC